MCVCVCVSPKSLSVPNTEMIFPRCTAIDSRWRKKVTSREFPEAMDRRRPKSVTNCLDCRQYEPNVYIATGMKWWLDSMAAYLTDLADAAFSAAAPARTAVAR